MLVKKSALLLLCCHLMGGAVSDFVPTVYKAQSMSSAECTGHHNPFHEEKLIEILQQVEQHIRDQSTTSNHSSCKSILEDNPSAPSGYYNITTTNGSAVQVYCDMEGTHCGGEGGWTRVTYVNMTQPGATCPQGLEQMSFNGSPYCGRFSSGVGCSSALLDTTISYQQVCGRVAGYQYYAPDAFYLGNAASIDGAFVDGLSIMYGSPRKHIWTYAAGFADYSPYGPSCPCNNGSKFQVPSFVGNNYYCESAVSSGYTCSNPNRLYSNDTLWDGQQCGGIEGTCCTHPNMPWFIKTLSETTTEDIELRACTQSNGCYGSVPIFLIEIYVR